jgi:hypothetical protein
MSAYVVSGWIIAMGGTAFYVMWTLVTERRVAAQVLALDDAALNDTAIGDTATSDAAVGVSTLSSLTSDATGEPS